MAFIKVESEDVKIEEAFGVKQEETQTGKIKFHSERLYGLCFTVVWFTVYCGGSSDSSRAYTITNFYAHQYGYSNPETPSTDPDNRMVAASDSVPVFAIIPGPHYVSPDILEPSAEMAATPEPSEIAALAIMATAIGCVLAAHTSTPVPEYAPVHESAPEPAPELTLTYESSPEFVPVLESSLVVIPEFPARLDTTKEIVPEFPVCLDMTAEVAPELSICPDTIAEVVPELSACRYMTREDVPVSALEGFSELLSQQIFQSLVSLDLPESRFRPLLLPSTPHQVSISPLRLFHCTHAVTKLWTTFPTIPQLGTDHTHTCFPSGSLYKLHSLRHTLLSIVLAFVCIPCFSLLLACFLVDVFPCSALPICVLTLDSLLVFACLLLALPLLIRFAGV
ncbi:hypothetical protein DPX16_1893 [Anabarilius grahami]|uniref:Uncharacterized protein n=1 Tax=Anabarilius grahami TaxID=495550 RepID=A0A3N0YRY9_ANAGA|nr:hypothetical protein DPX16_1893 [Anabarilius grahami]